MRVLVVTNPQATSTTARARRVLVDALDNHGDIEVAETEHRGHAAALACRAMRDEVDVVVALGGDGTVNEVINGVLTDGVHDTVPAVGVVPAGSTNVFARALGIPDDPLEATGALLDALRDRRRRRVGLGRADERWFCFAAGFGFDAAVVAEVERRRRRGRRSTNTLYVRTALSEFVRSDRRHPAITLERPDGTEQDKLHFAIVANVSPWTYLGTRPVTPTPQASFDSGLDVYARRRMGTFSLLRGLEQLVRPGVTPSGRGVLLEHDLSALTLRASRPLAFQVDGDYLGDRSEVRFWDVPQALAIIG